MSDSRPFQDQLVKVVVEGTPPPYFRISNAIFDLGLTPYGLAVYAYLIKCGNQDDGMKCWPSHRTIARHTGMSISRLKVALAELTGKGLLRIQSARDRHDVNLYWALQWFTVLFHEATPDTPSRVAATPSRVAATPPSRGAATEQDPVFNKTQEQERSTPPLIPPQGGARFEEFWKAYPRHEDRKGAEQEWKRLKVTPELLQIMLAAIEQQKRTEAWRDGKILYAVRWLKRHRWEDEPLLPGAGSQNGTAWQHPGLDLRTEEEKREADEKLEAYYREHIPQFLRPGS